MVSAEASTWKIYQVHIDEFALFSSLEGLQVQRVEGFLLKAAFVQLRLQSYRENVLSFFIIVNYVSVFVLDILQ